MRPVVLRDLTADRVQQCLAGLTCGATTKNKMRAYVVSFCNYLLGANRLPLNPITKFSVQRAKAHSLSTRTSSAWNIGSRSEFGRSVTGT